MTKEKQLDGKKKTGRPTDYTEALAELICERIGTSDMGLPRLCSEYDDMPAESTINRWRYQNEIFREKYAQAKMRQAELLADQCLVISDDDSKDVKYDKDGNELCNTEFVARSRLRIDTRKWLASKLLPKQYGDRIELEKKAEENDKLREELQELRKQLDEKNKKDY